jgi:protoheme ferro-lyase
MKRREGSLGRVLIAVGLSLSLLTVGGVDSARAARGKANVGVLIVDHGEPVEFNAVTYGSFREFLSHLIFRVGAIPPFVLAGPPDATILQDRGCYACEPPRPNPDLVDAWGNDFDGPATFVPATQHSVAHFRSVNPGPGVAEPDFYEHAGHSTRVEWEAMGNHSPNYEQKLVEKKAVIRQLKDRYSRYDVAFRVGYHIHPRVEGSLSIAEAVRQLVHDESVKKIVVAYHGVGFSDIMQTHMIHHEIHEELGHHGDVELFHAQPLGQSDWYIKAVVNKVRQELAKVPAKAPVALHLSAHGLSLSMCGSYDCLGDAYHQFAADLFERTKAAIERSVKRPGRLGIFTLYGDGADPASDPNNLMDSPEEALAKRKAAGFRHVIDIPYSFSADSRDTLIVLRDAYGLERGNWNAAYETSFVWDGMKVKITNSSFGRPLKIGALKDLIRMTLDPVVGV